MEKPSHVRKLIELSTIHGLRNHPLYNVWRNMKYRCSNEKQEFFYRYGGRGISVCEEWRRNFQAFYDWAISSGWVVGLQIDRINNDGNYEPNNCRIVSCSKNCRNRSSSKLTESDVVAIRYAEKGKHKHIAEKYGVSLSLINKIKTGEKWPKI